MRGNLQKSSKSFQLTLPGAWDEAPGCSEKNPGVLRTGKTHHTPALP